MAQLSTVQRFASSRSFLMNKISLGLPKNTTFCNYYFYLNYSLLICLIDVWSTRYTLPASISLRLSLPLPSVAAAGLAASRLTQLQLELAKTKILEQPKPIAGDSRLQSTIVDCKPLPSYAATSVSRFSLLPFFVISKL